MNTTDHPSDHAAGHSTDRPAGHASDLRTGHPTDRRPGRPAGPPTTWVLMCALVVVNALTSTGFSVATVITDPSPAAWYALIRCLALLGLAGVLVALRSRLVPVLGWVLVAVQLLDGVVGFADGDPVKGVGPWILGVVTAVTVVLHGRSLSRR
ncbi:hypothetical protein [Corynebacterium bovis]|uniref:hypothetical protein n=1 Tax=Corynebacterium bovis TaxID=36808 RepID=UPI000FBAB6FA|nr:hypothetical protein [Corynebacterium bovis]MDN8580094.1 hypothetical protein [Corynebacterium bovis]RRO88148.1 hypothetical protein CXF30_06595 [Corynebacterium bovis]